MAASLLLIREGNGSGQKPSKIKNNMKNRNTKNLRPLRILAAVLTLSLLSFSVKETHYYVVIGAFAKESNAHKFAGFARNLYLDASYKFNEERNLYYVSVMETPRKDDAKNWSIYLRQEKGLGDAWVYTSLPVNNDASAAMATVHDRASGPRYAAGGNLLVLDYGDAARSSGNNNLLEVQRADREAPAVKAAWTHADDISFLTGDKNVLSSAMKVLNSDEKIMTFQAQTEGGRTLPAEIMLVDYKKARKVASFKTDEYVGLRGKKQNQSITLVCDIFGYSVETKTVNLSNLSRARDVKQNSQGIWEVKFKLKPMEENEISILYNTVFYPDASVLQPSSKKQLDQVLSLMKAHPSYKIIVHSHCNRESRRDIKLPSNDGYFDISSAVVKSGSDKQLTKARSETIKAYLAQNGIDARRVGVMGWGSVDNIVSPTSANTAINDRIEIELTQR
jgi:outer membrane protein OmpA-like peptidoglycan-associated protein